MTASHSKSGLFIVLFTVFLDILGFSILIPLVPFLARTYEASNFEIGLLMSSYSLMQLLFAPVWGSFSDKIGRRPILLISLIGAALGHLLFAFSSSLILLFVARMLAGFFAASISTAQAYIADISPKDQRSKYMGLIGVALGLGFILGPPIGAFTASLGESFGALPPFGLSFPALISFALCLINFIFACFKLKESLPKKDRSKKFSRKWPLHVVKYFYPNNILYSIALVFFLSIMALSLMEVMLIPYMDDVFNWNVQNVGYGFAYIGFIMILTQGYFIRKFLPKLGEKKILMMGVLFFGLSLMAIPLAKDIKVLAVIMTVLAWSQGCIRPACFGLCSALTSKMQQGSMMGDMQSLSALGRIIGPALGGYLYDRFSEKMPFFASGLICLVGFIIVIIIFSKIPNFAKTTTTQKTPAQ